MQTKKAKGKHVRIQMWNGAYKQACAVSTIKSHINNMIIGVTEVSNAYSLLFSESKHIILKF